MSLEAITWAFQQPIKPASRKITLVALADCANDHGHCFPSLPHLVQKTSLNRKTVIDALDSLETDGLLADTGERTGKTAQVKVYQIKEFQNRNSSRTGTVPLLDGNSSTFSVKQFQKRNPYPSVTVKEPSVPLKSPSAVQAEGIYLAYPLKVGKPAALRAIAKQVKAGHPPEFLLTKTREFAAARNGDLAYCPHPATWFNQTRFLDSPETWLPHRPRTVPRSELPLRLQSCI